MSGSHELLDVVKLSGNGDIASLSRSLEVNPLPRELLYQILLTYLPDGVEPEAYTPLLQQTQQRFRNAEGRTLPDSPEQAATRASLYNGSQKKLRLTPLALPKSPISEDADPFALFLIHQAHKIDQSMGSLDLVRRLIEPFVQEFEVLQTWAISTLLPLLRLEYEYRPQEQRPETIAQFESLSTKETLNILLPRDNGEYTGQRVIVGSKEIKCLVGPWISGEPLRKRRKLNDGAHATNDKRSTCENEAQLLASDGDAVSGGWHYVNQWILDLSRHDFDRAVRTIHDWEGPYDVDYGGWKEEQLPVDQANPTKQLISYCRSILAVIVTSSISTPEGLQSSQALLERMCSLSKIQHPTFANTVGDAFSRNYIESINPAHLKYSNVLLQNNPLTSPDPSSVAFVFGSLTTASRLAQWGVQRSCPDVAALILFGSVEDQRLELQRILQRLRGSRLSDQDWISTRSDLLWLRDTGISGVDVQNERRGIFGLVSLEELELQILRALLDGGYYRLSIDLYLKKNGSLGEQDVKETILSTAFAHYDAATNGNRNRGQMKKAYDMVQFFKGQFPSEEFRQFEALLAATHSISFYSLTIQQGTPFLPVNIRAHRDPTSLVEKILKQNRGSYTHLDDLLDIGQNLVNAGLAQSEEDDEGAPSAADDDPDTRRLLARRKVTRMAIEAALAEDDFDTAYSYVVNRLHKEAKLGAQYQANGQFDDISWRAAYAAGRYPTSHDGTSALRRIEQRMELLSQALLLAPPLALPELLAVWQTCEGNMNEVLAQDAAHDEEADQMRDQHIPGGFSRSDSPQPQKSRAQMKTSIQEEAPLGLFDAAREVGSILGKSAFPLRGLQRGVGQSTESQARMREQEDADDADGANRVRKRDMVSNMVTGGLASGIGWVIGAPPAKD